MPSPSTTLTGNNIPLIRLITHALQPTLNRSEWLTHFPFISLVVFSLWERPPVTCLSHSSYFSAGFQHCRVTCVVITIRAFVTLSHNRLFAFSLFLLPPFLLSFSFFLIVSLSDKVATGSFDKTCKLWSAETGKCFYTFRGHTAEIVRLENMFTTA